MTNSESSPVAIAKKKKAFAVAGLVLGISAFALGFIPVLGFLLGVGSVVFGIVAILQNQSKGLSITGLVLGAIGGITSLIALIAVISIASTPNITTNSQSDSSQNSSTEETTPEKPAAPEAPAAPAKPEVPEVPETSWQPMGADLEYSLPYNLVDCDWGKCVEFEIRALVDCPNGVYVEANTKDAEGRVIGYTNDDVEDLRAGQTALLSMALAETGVKSIQITEYRCFK